MVATHLQKAVHFVARGYQIYTGFSWVLVIAMSLVDNFVVVLLFCFALAVDVVLVLFWLDFLLVSRCGCAYFQIKVRKAIIIT